jgi:hypothetical protein
MAVMLRYLLQYKSATQVKLTGQLQPGYKEEKHYTFLGQTND